jgi:hypothetical protein
LSNGRLSDVDLQQIDADYVASLAAHAKDRLIVVLADELKEARDPLNQNAQNSSRPPRSEPPWQGGPPSPRARGRNAIALRAMARNKPNQRIATRRLKTKGKCRRRPRTEKMRPRRRANRAGVKACKGTVAEINEADLVHGDETTWKEAGPLLWLWVFCSSTVTLYRVGYRTKEIIENLLGSEFAGWLMSDGYVIYRDYLRRLRCWAHLVRKAKGLQESMDRAHAQPFGNAALVIETCRKRRISPWSYIAQVVAQRRKGNPAPPLPGSAAK